MGQKLNRGRNGTKVSRGVMGQKFSRGLMDYLRLFEQGEGVIRRDRNGTIFE